MNKIQQDKEHRERELEVVDTDSALKAVVACWHGEVVLVTPLGAKTVLTCDEATRLGKLLIDNANSCFPGPTVRMVVAKT